MSTIGVKWLAQSTIYRDSIDLLAVIEYGEDRYCIEPIEVREKKIERHAAIGQPSLALTPDSARSLMQALWDAGIRPEKHEGAPAQVAALKAHIAFAERVTNALLPRVSPPQTGSPEP